MTETSAEGVERMMGEHRAQREADAHAAEDRAEHINASASHYVSAEEHDDTRKIALKAMKAVLENSGQMATLTAIQKSDSAHFTKQIKSLRKALLLVFAYAFVMTLVFLAAVVT